MKKPVVEPCFEPCKKPQGMIAASPLERYATLDRVEAKELLSSRIEKGTPARGGRARRFYRLTQTGASALSDARKTLEQMWHGKRWPPEVTA
jgi:DNA-binding PadR family transcriptional regulator